MVITKTSFIQVDHVVGPNSGKTGLEANLDVQYLMSLGANVTTTFWSTEGLREGQEPFLEWMLDLSNTSTVPYIFRFILVHGGRHRDVVVKVTINCSGISLGKKFFSADTRKFAASSRELSHSSPTYRLFHLAYSAGGTLTKDHRMSGIRANWNGEQFAAKLFGSLFAGRVVW